MSEGERDIIFIKMLRLWKQEQEGKIGGTLINHQQHYRTKCHYMAKILNNKSSQNQNQSFSQEQKLNVETAQVQDMKFGTQCFLMMINARAVLKQKEIET